MFYSAATDTVFIADSGGGAQPSFIIERQTDGTFVRSFTNSPGFTDAIGVTRGPDDWVFTTDFLSSRVFRWSPSGGVGGSIDLSASIFGPINIVWAGNAPEPIGITLSTFDARATWNGLSFDVHDGDTSILTQKLDLADIDRRGIM